ncbi:hypothetical protein L7F22_054794 [Adiantum nelumboides]|nr:hypothetical protein [Adiantum nelumboides]
MDAYNKKITVQSRGKTLILYVKLKGESIPTVSASAITSVMKKHLFACLVFAREVSDCDESNLSVLDTEKSMFLQQYSDRFSDSLPSQLPPERPEDHAIDLVAGSSPPNRPPYRVVALLGFKSVQDLSDHHHAVNEASKDLNTGSLERNYRSNANQLLQKSSHPAIVFGSSERIELFNFSDRQTGTDGKQPLAICDVAGVDDADITVQPRSIVGVTKRKGSLPMGSERGASGQVRKAKKAAKKVMASDRYEEWMLNKPISLMDGLSPTMCSQLEDNGFYTLRKLLQHYPRNYLNFLQAGQTIEDGQFLNFSGKIVSSRSHNKKGLGILEILIANEGHQVERGNENKEKNPVTLHVTKFFSGARYSSKWFLDKMVEKYPVGAYAAVSGKVKALQYTNHYEVKEYSLELVKDVENTDKAPSLYPIYPAKGRLDAKFFKLCIQKVLPNLPLNIDPFPEHYKVAHNLMDLREAYIGIHSPDTEAIAEKARQRFVFDEFLYLQVILKGHLCFEKQVGLPTN